MTPSIEPVKPVIASKVIKETEASTKTIEHQQRSTRSTITEAERKTTIPSVNINNQTLSKKKSTVNRQELGQLEYIDSKGYDLLFQEELTTTRQPPVTRVTNHHWQPHCSRYTRKDSCTVDDNCTWCNADDTCIVHQPHAHRACMEKFPVVVDGGPCSARTCKTCVESDMCYWCGGSGTWI